MAAVGRNGNGNYDCIAAPTAVAHIMRCLPSFAAKRPTPSSFKSCPAVCVRLTTAISEFGRRERGEREREWEREREARKGWKERAAKRQRKRRKEGGRERYAD